MTCVIRCDCNMRMRAVVPWEHHELLPQECSLFCGVRVPEDAPASDPRSDHEHEHVDLFRV